MLEPVIVLQVNDEDVTVVEEDFQPIHTFWNEYRLESGVRVRIHLDVLKIFRQVTPTGQLRYSPDGDPLVVVRHQIRAVTRPILPTDTPSTDLVDTANEVVS